MVLMQKSEFLRRFLLLYQICSSGCVWFQRDHWGKDSAGQILSDFPDCHKIVFSWSLAQIQHSATKYDPFL